MAERVKSQTDKMLQAAFAWDDPLLLEDQLSEEEKLIRERATKNAINKNGTPPGIIEHRCPTTSRR